MSPSCLDPGPFLGDGRGDVFLGDGASYGRAWGGDRDSLHTPPGLPGGHPGAAAAEPTLTHTPLRPRPPSPEAGPSLTVSPGSRLGALGEKGELTLGLRPVEGRCTRT